MADITPVTREEFYLAKAGGQDVPVPPAVTREEHYLEKLSNDSVAVPTPVTRREKFLYFACGGEIDLPSEDRMTRLERLIAKAGGMDVATPTAITRLEKFWANVEGGGWKVTELTGTLPLTFRSNGTALINYLIFGTADGAGAQTENLFNINDMWIVAGRTTYSVNGQTLTVTGNWYVHMIIPVERNTNYYLGFNTVSSTTFQAVAAFGVLNGELNNRDVVVDRQEVPFILTTGEREQIAIVFYSGFNTFGTSVYDDIMLVKGSTPPSTYVPYGYKLPITLTSETESKDTDIYIGDSKLLSGDYVDYEAGKIYKAKRIHEDTVTIDGIEWDILDYDHDEVYKVDGTRAKHTVTIQTHDCINELQYSARQAAFAFPNGLAAGTYHFTVGVHPYFNGDVGKLLTFTIANAIPASGQLVFNGAFNQTLVGTTISAFASPTNTTEIETVTMTEGDTGTDLGTILRSKTDTINSIDRALLGSNNWLESALRQYLNSDKTAGNVFTPQTPFDRPPVWVSSIAGFLNGKSANFISHIGTVKKKTGLNTISDGDGTATHDEKVFLLSRSEVFMGDEYAGGEDTPYAYYKNYSDYQIPSTNADKNRIKYRAGIARVWWLRSPNAGYASYVRLVDTSGAWYSHSATNASGVAPACCIVLDDMDDWVKQTFYTEVDADLPAIETFKGENTLDSTETLGEVTINGRIKEA